MRAGLPDPDGSLAPGQFLRVRLTVGTAKRLPVPTTVLSAELNQRVVHAVEDGAVHPRPVETGKAYHCGRVCALWERRIDRHDDER